MIRWTDACMADGAAARACKKVHHIFHHMRARGRERQRRSSGHGCHQGCHQGCPSGRELLGTTHFHLFVLDQRQRWQHPHLELLSQVGALLSVDLGREKCGRAGRGEQPSEVLQVVVLTTAAAHMPAPPRRPLHPPSVPAARSSLRSAARALSRSPMPLRSRASALLRARARTHAHGVCAAAGTARPGPAPRPPHLEEFGL